MSSHGHPFSVEVTLPPLSVVFFKSAGLARVVRVEREPEATLAPPKPAPSRKKEPRKKKAAPKKTSAKKKATRKKKAKPPSGRGGSRSTK